MDTNDRWKEKYYDKVDELNRAEKILAALMDGMKQALELMREVAPYLEQSSDVHAVHAVFQSQSTNLRNMADKIDKKDASIARFRKFLEENN